MSSTQDPCEICGGSEEILLSPAKQQEGEIIDEIWGQCECIELEHKHREEREKDVDN